MTSTESIIKTCKNHLEYCVLQIISRTETQVSDLITELIDVNLINVEGTMYPMLNQMHLKSLITYRIEEVPELGLIKKIYTITDEGKTKLKILSTKWDILVKATNQINAKN
jgi:DNA-binding PadR family transcriptional regulator